ncbi:hypothetical protein BpHYR1_019699, partial [Brachionus plicatilis]
MMYFLDQQSQWEMFNLSVSFNNYDTTLNRYFNVTNNHFGDVRCFNSMKTTNNTLECELLLISQNYAHEFKIEFGDCSTRNFKVEGKFIDGFGTNIPTSLAHHELPDTSIGQEYLLRNSEFKFDANLVGFEFFSVGSGQIEIKVKTPDINQTITSWLINTSPGHNKIFNPYPLFFPKHSQIIVNFVSSSKIPLEKSLFYEDFIFNGTSYVPLKNRNFLFKALIDTGFYFGSINFTKQYDFATDHIIRIGSTEQKFTVSNHKSMELVCTLIEDMDVDCFLSIISQTPENTILADYGTCENETISSTSTIFKSFFGPFLAPSELFPFFSNNKKYLLTNNEFKYDTNLMGFEILATQSGDVRIEVGYFSQCGQLIPCSTYFKRNIQFPQFSQVFLNQTFGLSTGLNEVSIKPILVLKGAVLVLSYIGTGQVGVSNFTELKTYSDYAVVGDSLEELSKEQILVFMVNSVVEDGHFLDEIAVNKTYPLFSTYYQAFKLSNSTINIRTTIDLINGSSVMRELNYYYNDSELINFSYNGPECLVNYENRFYDDLTPNCKLEFHFTSTIDHSGISDLSSPAIYYRADIIKFSINLKLNFIQKHEIVRSWHLFKMDEYQNFSQPILIDENPTFKYARLLLRSNTLNYGTYKLVHRILVKVNTGYLSDIQNENEHLVETYFKIVPSGIALFCLENGQDFIKIGLGQNLELNTVKYGYDMDFLATIDSLDINFYCLEKNKGQHLNYNDLIFNNTNNLIMFYNESAKSNECFNDTAQFEFDPARKILKINAGGLSFKRNKNYMFILDTIHLNETYYQ